MRANDWLQSDYCLVTTCFEVVMHRFTIALGFLSRSFFVGVLSKISIIHHVNSFDQSLLILVDVGYSPDWHMHKHHGSITLV